MALLVSAILFSATTGSLSAADFVKGINFNGGAVTVEGNSWISYSSALSSGLSFSPAPSVWTSQMTPSPAVNSATSSMLNSAVYSTGNFSFSQTMSNGSYHVYFWVMENYQNNARAFDIRLEGNTVATQIGTMNLSSWVKYGPYSANVTDGALNVDLMRRFGDPHLMGMAIYSGTSNPNPNPIQYPTTVEKWGTFEVTLSGPNSGNPYREVSVSANFTRNGTTRNIRGFYDGNGVYRVRFMPEQEGAWTFTTSSNAAAMNGQSGSFSCTPPTGNNRGPVSVRDQFHFQYADGTPYVQLGTTSYDWTNESAQMQEQTLNTLAGTKFNKIRFLVFPKYYDFHWDEPEMYPFAGSKGSFDFNRPNYAYFQKFDNCLKRVLELGIEADIIVLHPYDNSGIKDMGEDNEKRYLEYLIARAGAHRNVWWSMCNEWELKSTDVNYWDRIGQHVQNNDPYNHLRSIHNVWEFYDYHKPWVTHLSLQAQEPNISISKSRDYRAQFGKPIVWDEVRYEGNFPMPYFWGLLTAQEMTEKFWSGTIHGTYVGHSETYTHPEDIIWWSRGGVLRGQSPARIAFLKTIMDMVPGKKLDPLPGNMQAAQNGSDCFLYYYSTSQATSRSFSLPSGNTYQAHVIDTWNMTRSDVGTRSGNFSLSLPNQQYMAVLFIKSGQTQPLPPVATGDAYSTGRDRALTVNAPGVLGNDNDPNGDTLSAILTSGPSHGTLSLQASGSFTYTPASGYTGSDSFAYKARDSGGLESSAVTVTITISLESFVKGINFNGNAVTIDGNQWLSYSAALSSGLSFTASPRVWTTQLTPSPAADTDTRSMLNSAIWNDSSFSFSQTLSNGTYDVYFWVFENHQSNYRSFHVNLEGQQVAASIGNLPYQSWAKYGPYRSSVSDGALSVNLVKITGDPHLMGMAIFSVNGSPDVPVGPGIYLSDLNWTSATSGHGPVERDASNGEINAGDGETITLNGVAYAKGLGVHSQSDIRYALNGQFATFLSDIGVDDEVGSNGSVVFQVWLDGTLAYDSGTMNGTSATKSINLNVAGKNELRLVVTNAGDNGNYDHADWAGARLTATGVYLSDLNWTSAKNGHGPAERDRSNGDMGGSDGATLTLNGVTYAKGLGVHAPSDIKYALNGQYSSLIADLGVDDEVGSNGSVVFQVWLDGTLAYDSGVLSGSSATKAMALDVSGANELRLVVTTGGNNNEYDHADWAVAQLIPAGAASMTANSQGKGTALTTSLSAQPNPAGVGENVTFVVAANAKGETYAWDFGDGSSGSGATAVHAYAVPGTYTASVAVSNSMGIVRTENLLVTVVEQGFPGSSVEQSIPFTIKAFKGGVSFTHSNKDAVSFSGVLPSGTVLAGQSVRVNVGGVEATFLVNARGQARSSSGTLKFNSEKGLLSVKLSRGAFGQTWAEQGLISSQAANATSKWLVRIGVNQTVFGAEVNTNLKTKTGVAVQFKK